MVAMTPIEPSYIVAGHFGTTLSYATIAKRICAGLSARGMLAGTINFDDSYSADFQPVRFTDEQMQTARFLCVTLPGPHAEQLAQYARSDRSILYMSPNTDDLDSEALRVSWAFGGLITPSRFCEYTVLRCTGRVSARVPLGVDAMFADAAAGNLLALRNRLDAPPRILHMSTDGFLPGRKGTDALLDGLVRAKDKLPEGTEVTIHTLPSIQFDVRSECAERDLSDLVNVVAGNKRGLSDEALLALISAHDLVVQPSRCEGFGITQLLALVAGVPLVTTHATGMAEFLGHFRGCWLPLRHGAVRSLAGEEGAAPDTSGSEVAGVLALATSRTMRDMMLQYQSRIGEDARAKWTWANCIDQWTRAMDESLTND